MIKNEDYFAVYEQHFAECKSARIAWVRTEREFFKLYGMKRFLTHLSLTKYRRMQKSKPCRRVVLHIVDEIQMK